MGTSTKKKPGRTDRVKGPVAAPAAERNDATAEAETRRRAAEWLGAVRAVLNDLRREVEAVNDAIRPGSLLARCIDKDELNRMYLDLASADNAASDIYLLGYPLPVPNLLRG